MPSPSEAPDQDDEFTQLSRLLFVPDVLPSLRIMYHELSVLSQLQDEHLANAGFYSEEHFIRYTYLTVTRYLDGLTAALLLPIDEKVLKQLRILDQQIPTWPIAMQDKIDVLEDQTEIPPQVLQVAHNAMFRIHGIITPQTLPALAEMYTQLNISRFYRMHAPTIFSVNGISIQLNEDEAIVNNSHVFLLDKAIGKVFAMFCEAYLYDNKAYISYQELFKKYKEQIGDVRLPDEQLKVRLLSHISSINAYIHIFGLRIRNIYPRQHGIPAVYAITPLGIQLNFEE